MAFTRAAQVAEHVRRHVLPGVAVSVGKATGEAGIEVVVKGFSHPEDGLSRVWHIELLGPSGMMLQMVITGLRKAGFELSGTAPLMKGRLTEALTKLEIAKMRSAEREEQKKVEKAQFKAEVQAEASLANAKVMELQEELERLKEMIEDMALMPQPRGRTGPQGPAGRDGVDGKDGTALDLEQASINDLGDVNVTDAPDERSVLTFSGGQWKALQVPRFLQSISGGGGPGGGGGSTGGGDNSGGGGTGLSLWTEDENGHLIPATDEQQLGAELNPVDAIYLTDEGIFFNGVQLQPVDGELHYNGAPVGGITVQNRDRNDLTAAPTNVAGNISTLSFDASSGFEIEDLGNGSFEAFVKMNSSFAPWHVAGQTTLDPTGEEPVEFVAGPGITITTDETTTPQSIRFEASGSASGGIPEAPMDGKAYVRIMGAWVRLSDALQALIDGSDITTGETDAFRPYHIDGGDLETGTSQAGVPLQEEQFQQFDGGEIT